VSRRLATWLFLIALGYAMAGYYWQLDDYPPYVDFDSATLGIFVNNVTYQPRYDHYFATSSQFQDQYRALWAAFFLPLSVPLSACQRVLRIPYYDVDRLLKVAGLVFGLAGSLCVARLVRAGERGRWIDAAFVVGFLAVSPPFLLYLRTAVPHFLLSFLLFWAAIMFVVTYTHRLESRYLYATACAIACYRLAPYPPLAYLPVVLLGVVILNGRLARTLRNPHAYLAAIIAVVAPYAAAYVLAMRYDGSYQQYMAKVSAFVTRRAAHAVPLEVATWSALREKLGKLVNQHLLFLRDTLGDRSRADDLWTLNALHVGWLAAVPVGLRGLWKGIAARDEATIVCALVLAITYGAALTIGWPEGRYMLTAVPCYAVFAGMGVRSSIPEAARRTSVLALILLVTATNTYWLVTGEYNAGMLQRWRTRAGMREALAVIRTERTEAEQALLEWPDLQYEDWLYLQMLADFRVVALGRLEMLSMVQGQGGAVATGPRALFVVQDTGAQAEINGWRFYGFEVAREVADPASGRRLVLLAKHLPAPAGAGGRIGTPEPSAGGGT
jgi:4-amino-4-deoxy-L-arabinose transferase-like glycosyltransferase